MAELDDKLLKNLDQTLQNMNTHLQNLESTLRGVKGGMDAAFNPSVIKAFSDEIRGLQAARIIDADKNVAEVNKIYSAMQELSYMVKTGMKLEPVSLEQLDQYKKRLEEIDKLLEPLAGKRNLPTDQWLERKSLYNERDRLRDILGSENPVVPVPLKKEEIVAAVEALKQYEEAYKNIRKGEQQRAVELANIQQKEKNELLKQEQQLNKEIEAEERQRNAEAQQRYKEAVEANKAQVQAEEESAKLRREQRTAQSKAAYKQQAQEDATATKKMNQAISQQIQYYRQLHSLYKGYKDLQAKPNKTKEDIAILEQTKQKILEILRLSKQLELENKGSRQAGINATGFQRLADNLRNASKETKTLKANLNNLLPTLQRLASAFGVAFSVRGLAQFGKKLIETRGEFERQQVALRSILQNKQLADEIWDKTMQAALQSPFTAMQLTTYTKQLAAYRIETDKLFETTKRLADVSAGLGVDMNRLILAYGQVKAANYLRASEIRQFTEAGVNVLGELRDYFNDVKGMSVDTAQVMEMVTKRLVTFEDVEAIFKRMTDQGGIFYEMQYVQSQTVRGQIAKLHDAYDQMLNSIGQANEGALKNMVSLLNSIVKNWQEFKTVIDLIAWPLLISLIYKFALGLTTTAAASVALSTSMNGVVVAGARMQLMFKRLFAVIAAHPWLALGAAVLSVGVALKNHAKHVRDINKRYEELMSRTYETQKNLSGYSETIQNNLDTMKKATKGSEEYNEASRENENIVKKLKDQYPDLLADIDLQKDGYQKLIEKIKEYNEELENQIRLEYAARAGFWQDDLSTNIAELQEAQRKREMQFLQNRELAEKRYLELKAQGKESTEDIWEAQIRGAKNWEEQQKIIEANAEAMRGGGDATLLLKGYVVPGIGGFGGGGNEQTNIANLSGNIKSESLVINDLIRKQLTKINEDLGEDIQQFLTDNEEKVNELFKYKEGEGWKILNKQITKFFTSKGATDEESRKVIQDFLDQFLIVPIKLDWDTSGGNSNTQTPPKTEEQILSEWRRRIKLIEDMNKKYKELSKSVYGYAKSEQKVREAFQTAWKEANMPFSMESIDFTSDKAVADALAMFRGKIPQKLLSELEKTISERESTIELDVQVRIREDFGKQMEKAFNDYELTLELDKLNLPKGLAADMWGIEETDLQDLRKRLSQMYMGLRDENGQLSDEAFKDYEKFLNKIDDLERKHQKERLKDYSKYLEAQYSERVKIEMDYVRKLAALEAETAIKEPQKREIREGLRREFLEKSRKQDWEDFKGSEFYVGMMEDLEKQGSASLEVMRKKLLEMRENAENLSPRALKEVVNALEKIDELEKKRIPPLKRIREEQEKLKGIEIKDVYERIAANQDKLAQDEQEQKDLERMIMLEEERQKLEKQGITLEEAKARLTRSEQALSLILPSLDTRSDGTKEGDERRRILTETVNQAKKEVETWAEIVRILSGQATIDKQERGSRYGGLSLSDLKKRRDDAKQRIKDLEGVIGKDEELVKAQKDLEDAWNDTWEAAKRWAQSINGIFDGVMDTIGYFSDSTSTLTAEWKEFGDTSIAALTDLVSGIQAYQQANAAAQKAGLATGLFTANGLQLAMVVLGVIIKVVQAIAKLHDARIDKEIEQSKERVDDLQKAYERLEKQIEKTFDTVSYMREFNKETQNLYEQIEEANRQIAAAQDYKSEDKRKEAIDAAEDAKQQALDAIEEIKQAQIEVFGGIGEDNYRNAAEGFVDAWKSAFFETGDGLQGLQDHFDEFLNDWFVKQATMRVTQRTLEPLFRQIDSAVDQYGSGGANVMMQELQNIREKFGVIAPQLSEALEELAGMWGLQGEGGLSGLAAGIQGMPEEQANILEAYWNSVRGYTASIDMNVARIVDMMVANYGGGRNVESNPMLQQLNLIAANTAATHTILQSVTKSGHTMGGSGIKVFVN